MNHYYCILLLGAKGALLADFLLFASCGSVAGCLPACLPACLLTNRPLSISACRRELNPPPPHPVQSVQPANHHELSRSNHHSP
jgi:hypothetical protein